MIIYKSNNACVDVDVDGDQTTISYVNRDDVVVKNDFPSYEQFINFVQTNKNDTDKVDCLIGTIVFKMLFAELKE